MPVRLPSQAKGPVYLARSARFGVGSPTTGAFGVAEKDAAGLVLREEASESYAQSGDKENEQKLRRRQGDPDSAPRRILAIARLFKMPTRFSAFDLVARIVRLQAICSVDTTAVGLLLAGHRGIGTPTDCCAALTLSRASAMASRALTRLSRAWGGAPSSICWIVEAADFRAVAKL